MHWCADETQAVINMLSTVDVVWLWLRSALARLFRLRVKGPEVAACDCGHEHGGSTGPV
jgi:hypothetical protein